MRPPLSDPPIECPVTPTGTEFTSPKCTRANCTGGNNWHYEHGWQCTTLQWDWLRADSVVTYRLASCTPYPGITAPAWNCATGHSWAAGDPWLSHTGKLLAVVMVCSVRTVVAPTTGLKEADTQNFWWVILGWRKVAYEKRKIKFYYMKNIR
jgi:hypothetical protein